MPKAEPKAPVGVVSSARRWPWWLLAWASLLLAGLGVLLPGLPTTPFVLLSAWAAARGSPALRRRLLADRRFGPLIRDWQRDGAVDRRAKRMALLSMTLCAALVIWLAPHWGIAAFACACMAAVAVWLWRRPEPIAQGLSREP